MRTSLHSHKPQPEETLSAELPALAGDIDDRLAAGADGLEIAVTVLQLLDCPHVHGAQAGVQGHLVGPGPGLDHAVRGLLGRQGLVTLRLVAHSALTLQTRPVTI